MITVDRLALLRALEPVAKASGGPKALLDVYRKVRLTTKAAAGGQSIHLRAVRDGQQADTHVECSAKSTCDVLVDARAFVDAVRKLAGSHVDIRPNESFVTITAGKTTMRLPYTDGADAPSLVAAAAEGWATIPAAALRDALSVRYAASQDGTRANLHYVLLAARDGALVATATDGHRCAVHTIPVQWAASWQAQVPIPGVDLLLDAADGASEIELAVDDMVHARARGVTFATQHEWDRDEPHERKPTFPPVAKLFAEVDGRSGTVVRASRTALIDAVDRVATVVGRDHGALFKVGNGSIVVQSKSDRGEVTDEIACDVDGPSVTVDMAAQYAREALANMAGDEIAIRFGDELGPVQFETEPENEGDEARKALVMPRRQQ